MCRLRDLAQSFRQLQPKSQKSFPFFDLPYPLRSDILTLVAGDTPSIKFFSPKTGCQGTAGVKLRNSAAAAGNKRFRQEVLLETLKIATVEIEDMTAVLEVWKWLSKVKFDQVVDTSMAIGFEAVRKLDFPSFSQVPLYATACLLRGLANLKQVEIRLRRKDLIYYTSPRLWDTNKGLEYLRQEYPLNLILGVERLEVLVLHKAPEVGDDDRGSEAIRVMTEWFDAELAAREKSVVVKLMS
jgi:hypothetical protein